MSSSELPSPKNSHFPNLSTALMLLFLALLLASLHTTGAQIGVCYKRQGNNLPPPDQVIDLYSLNGIERIRLYDPDPDALEALRGTNIEVMLGVPNDQLESISSSQSSAGPWVRNNVVPYAFNNVHFRYITVRNEVEPNDTRFAPFLLGAMQNIRTALGSVNLNQIKVSTAFKYDRVMAKSFLPSEGTFNAEYRDLFNSILPFLRDNDSPLMLNMYPFFSYLDNPGNNSGQVRFDYATFTGPTGLVSDPPLSYSNLFDAMMDESYSALEKEGMGSLNIVVSETGWPTAGGGQATTVDNEDIYNNNLIQHVHYKGTPKRPEHTIETYIFGMFDAGNKEPELGKHFGLFSSNMELKYPINLDEKGYT